MTKNVIAGLVLAAVCGSPLFAQGAKAASGKAPPAKAPPAKALATAPAIDSAAKKPATDTVAHFSGVVGLAIDSLRGDTHSGGLAGATVTVVGTNRRVLTDQAGQFRIDSVPPGEYRLMLSHPMLDTVGMAVETQPVLMPAGRYAVVRLYTPAKSTVMNIYCPKERLINGPGVVLGRVLDADTDAPDSGARVVLIWTQLEVSQTVGVKRMNRVREAHVDEHGMFSICGVPANLKGQLRASLNRESTADVELDAQGETLLLTTLHIASPDSVRPTTVAVAAAPGAPAAPSIVGLRRGHAVLAGKITDLLGRPLQGGSITVDGAASTTEAKQNGTYTLRDLPAGTQALIVRHVGFAPVRVAVDLSNTTARHSDIKMSPALPRLAAVTIEGKRDKGLRDVGFSNRQKAGIGHYLTEDQIDQRQPMQMTDLFTQMPGLRVDYSSGYPQLTSSRDAMGGCVSYVIDGIPTQMPDPHDFNDYMHPEEVSAVEVYSPSEAPAQFQVGGNSSCAVIVIWTKTKVGG